MTNPLSFCHWWVTASETQILQAESTNHNTLAFHGKVPEQRNFGPNLWVGLYTNPSQVSNFLFAYDFVDKMYLLYYRWQ